MLEDIGFVVRVAGNGQVALDLLQAQSFDLVLMDQMMPVMDGLTATREIRRREASRGSHTPIVALTAAALADERDGCMRAGMDDFLAKPFRRADLLRMLQRWVPTTGTVKPTQSAPALTAAGGPIDVSALQSIRSFAGGDRILQDAVLHFTATVPAELVLMRDLAGTGDRTALRRSSHSLKSSAGMLGLQQLSRTMLAIEHGAESQPTIDQLALIQRATAEFTTGVDLLTQLIRNYNTQLGERVHA